MINLKKSNASLTERLFVNDFDQFLKYRTIPFLFITHIILVGITSYIIYIESHNFDELVFHNRTIQSIFFFHEGTSEPTNLCRIKGYIYKYNQLLEHLDKVINQIFIVNEASLFHIEFDNIDQLELLINPSKFDISQAPLMDFSRKITKDNLIQNPLRRIGSDKKIKQFLQVIQSMSIQLSYDYNLMNHNQNVIVEIKYDLSKRGLITYTIEVDYQSKNFESISFKNAQMLLVIIQALIATIEIILISKKIHYNLWIMMAIKGRLTAEESSKANNKNKDETKDEDEDEDRQESLDVSVINFGKIESNSHNNIPSASAWNEVTIQDKLKFIPKWFAVFIVGDLFHIMGGLSFLSYGYMTSQTINYFGFSSIFSWLALGYYFQGHVRYSYIYDTLNFTLNMYSKLLLIFIILFIGICLLHIPLFPSSIHWFNGLYNSFASLAAEVFGDSYLLIWTTTIDLFPIKTVVFAWVIYVIFTGCHLRVMFVMTEEAFQHVLIQKKFDWISQNKISVEDYIKHEMTLSEDDQGQGDEGEQSSDANNLFFDDMWIKAIVEKDDVNKILEFDVGKLNDKLYNTKQIKKYFYSKAKKVKKKAMSNQVMNEIFEDNSTNYMNNAYENFGKTETVLMCEAHQGIEKLLQKLNQFIEMIKVKGFEFEEGEDMTKKLYVVTLKNRIKMLNIKIKQSQSQ